MTQENKELLLKDLCARLPYGVKVLYEGQVKEIQYIEPLYNELKLLDDFSNYTIGIEDIKPYLRPMSNMTDEERKEYNKIQCVYGVTSISKHGEMTDWLNKHHFDYRGLIPMDLAIEVTKENNPYEY